MLIRKVCYALPMILLSSLLFMLPIYPSNASNEDKNLYAIQDLGTLPGENFSFAAGINVNGQVVGFSGSGQSGETGAWAGNARVHAFLWTAENGMKDLGTLPSGNISMATCINNNGQVVGTSEVAGTDHLFLWTAEGGMIDLGTPLGGNSSHASGINDKGQVVGYSGQVNGTGFWLPNWPRAFLWTAENGMKDLGTLPGGNWSFAFGINDIGQVVGYSNRTGEYIHGFLWTAEDGMKDLGTVSGGKTSVAYAINNKGQVVGTARFPDLYLWTARGDMVDLGTFPGAFVSVPTGINDIGQVVGYADVAGTRHAFLCPAEGGMIDLGTLPGENGSAATGINEKGQIVGNSPQTLILLEEGRPCHAILWEKASAHAAVFGRYVFSEDKCWFAYNKTVQQLRTEGYDISGEDNWLLQVNYSRSNYTFKSTIVGLSWPNVTTVNLEGKYDLNTTAYRILDDGALGERLLSTVRLDQPARMGLEWSCQDPRFGVGFNPSAFTIGNAFIIGTGGVNVEFRVDRTEVLGDTAWGQNQTYVLEGSLANSTHYYSDVFWCDNISGIMLRQISDTKTPEFIGHEEQTVVETGVVCDKFEAVNSGDVCQFHVDTNSTLSSFGFDPSKNKASLALYGLAGTSGVCNVTVPKVLVPTGYGFEVLIDGQTTSYTLTEDTSNYYVGVSYSHSTHTLTISFLASTMWDQLWFWPTVAAIIVVIVAAAYLLWKRRTKKTLDTK